MSRRSKYTSEGDVSAHESGSTCPWPVWTDASLNNEKWDFPKNGPQGYFLDSQQTPLPPSLKVEEWTKPNYLTKIENPITIFVPNTSDPDMVSNNHHLMHSEFMRSFISTIVNLEYYGRNGLDVDDSSENFYWSGRLSPWRGWFHIYSLNRAGRDAVHSPLVNPHGKYIVRLYFLGSWRRIIVDDLIPVNLEGLPLLPRTGNNYELWPMLLAKAMLKIASLTWIEEEELIDFNPVSCLTGWLCLNLNVEHMSSNDKWDLIHKYVTHFEWPKKTEDDEKRLEMLPAHKNEKKRKKLDTTSIVPEKPTPVTIFALLDDMRNVLDGTLLGLTPCWSHPVYIFLTRDIPCSPEEVQEPLPLWKRYRWIYWAIKQGLVNAEDYFAPIRFIKMISALSTSRSSNDSYFPLYSLEDDKKRKSRFSINETQSNKKIKELAIKSQMDMDTNDVNGNSHAWYNMNKLTPFIKEIHFFYRVSYFQFCTRITDMIPNELPADVQSARLVSETASMKSSRKPVSKSNPDSLEFSPFYKWQHHMKPSRNEPLFLCIDSADHKCLLLNFSSMPTFPKLVQSFTNCLVIETCNLFDCKGNKPLLSIQSDGNISHILKLLPGRHLLRLFCRCKGSFSLIISSETIFHVGDRLKMHSLMVQETKIIGHKVKMISDAMRTMLLSFGNEDFRDNLMLLYKSYGPDVIRTTKVQSLKNEIHELFLNELSNAIASSVIDADSLFRSLRILFLNPNIGRESQITAVQKCNREDRAASVIQSFFRMILIRSYKMMHSRDHKGFTAICNTLATIIDLFDYNNRESIARVILENLVRHKKTMSIYWGADDFGKVLQVQECKGVLLKVIQNQWVPILRITISPLQDEIPFAAMDLFTQIPRYKLLVFRKEDGKQIRKLCNNVLPTKYPFTEFGYTVVVYGWSEEFKSREVEWTFHVTTIKGTPLLYKVDDTIPLSLKTELPTLQVLSISKIYVPNWKKQMCNVFMQTSDVNMVSIRFATSYKRVWIKLRVLDDKGIIIREVHGKSSVIIPFLMIDNDLSRTTSDQSCAEDESKSLEEDLHSNSTKSFNTKQYSIESYVSFRSWPLTDKEWLLVKDIKSAIDHKDKEITLQTTTIVSVGNKRFSKLDLIPAKQSSKRSLNISGEIGAPFWSLEVVVDYGSSVEINVNTKEIDELRSMKASWLEKEPDRLTRGKLYRDEFIEEWELLQPTSEISMESIASLSKKPSKRKKMLSKSNIIDEKRFHTPPVNPNCAVPQLDLARYVKYGDKNACRSPEMCHVPYFEYFYSMLVDEMKILQNEEMAEYASSFQRYDELYAQWQTEMETEYETNMNVVDRSNSYEDDVNVSSRLSKKKSQRTLLKTTT